MVSTGGLPGYGLCVLWALSGLFQKCITDQWRYSYRVINSIDQLHCLGQHGLCLRLGLSLGGSDWLKGCMYSTQFTDGNDGQAEGTYMRLGLGRAS